MKNTNAKNTIHALRIVFGTHGLPEQIVSDNGPQFVAIDFEEYCRSRGIIHTLIAPYNPKSNGAAERFVQTFKQGMRRMQEDGVNVDLALSSFLLKYRITPHPATGFSPSEMLFNRKLRTLLDLVSPTPKRRVQQKPKTLYEERTKRNFDKGTKDKNFEIGQLIFARNYRDGSKWLPGRILEKLGTAMFRVRTPRGIWRRHLDQLKPNLTDQDQVDFDSEESTGDEQEMIEEQEEYLSAEEQNGEPEIIVPPVANPQPREEVPPALRRSERTRKPRKIFEPE